MNTVIDTKNAPGAIGPYSQGIATQGAGKMIFTSGQLPIDNATGALETADIKKAAKNSLENCKAVIESAGAKLSDVVKTTVFLTDLADFAAMNDVYGTYFASNPPARSCVQVVALPKGAKIEIEMLAFV